MHLVKDSSHVDICLQDSTFTWEENYPDVNDVTTNNIIQQPILSKLDLTVHSKEFLGIIGSVGAGKSSLFAAILMELQKSDGTIYCN